jgi:predicted transcriptional regulator of viral defense system
MKYQKEFENKFKERIFSTRDLRIFLKQMGASENYVSLFLNNNIKKGRIVRLKKGVYSFSSNIENIEKAFSPSYHALQDALSIHGLWTQQTIPVLVTPKKIRSGERQVLGSKILIRRINRKMFFGFEEKKYFGSWVSVSDLEKTLIDFYYYNEPLDKKVISKIIKKINSKKLLQYLKQTNKRTEEKVKKILKKTSK